MKLYRRENRHPSIHPFQHWRMSWVMNSQSGLNKRQLHATAFMPALSTWLWVLSRSNLSCDISHSSSDCMALFVLKVHQIQFASAVGHTVIWEESCFPFAVLGGEAEVHFLKPHFKLMRMYSSMLSEVTANNYVGLSSQDCHSHFFKKKRILIFLFVTVITFFFFFFEGRCWILYTLLLH